MGGPQLYVQEYGHPMLRRRHLPFPISESERDQWLMCMNSALNEVVEDPQLRDRTICRLRQSRRPYAQ